MKTYPEARTETLVCLWHKSYGGGARPTSRTATWRSRSWSYLPIDDKSGRKGMSGLCILGRPYIVSVQAPVW